MSNEHGHSNESGLNEEQENLGEQAKKLYSKELEPSEFFTKVIQTEEGTANSINLGVRFPPFILRFMIEQTYNSQDPSGDAGKFAYEGLKDMFGDDTDNVISGSGLRELTDLAVEILSKLGVSNLDVNTVLAQSKSVGAEDWFKETYQTMVQSSEDIDDSVSESQNLNQLLIALISAHMTWEVATVKKAVSEGSTQRLERDNFSPFVVMIKNIYDNSTKEGKTPNEAVARVVYELAKDLAELQKALQLSKNEP